MISKIAHPVKQKDIVWVRTMILIDCIPKTIRVSEEEKGKVPNSPTKSGV